MSEEREAGMRKKGRHEVKRIHLGGGVAGAVTGIGEVTLGRTEGGGGGKGEPTHSLL